MNMPINAIKKILRSEVEEKINNIDFLDQHQDPIDGYYHLVQREFVQGIRETVMAEFDAMTTEEEADKFIRKYYRMSLNEWVDSI